MTLTSVSHIIDCGTQEGCVTPVFRIWNQALGFPLFSIMQLFDTLNPGRHSSGVVLTILFPLNSLIFVVIAYLLLAKFFGSKGTDRKQARPTA